MSTESRTVLIVDDDVDVRASIADALDFEGYRVITAPDGREALNMLLMEPPERPDVILLDMMMPNMDGWTFRAEQQKNASIADIPVIVFSAYGAPHHTAQELEAAGFVKKPVRLEQLLEALNRVLV